jgi:integrase
VPVGLSPKARGPRIEGDKSMGERRANGLAPASGGLVPMQNEGYSANGRKLVKTGVPGIYKRGGRYVVIVRDPSGRPRKHAAATMKVARATKASLTADVQRGEWRERSRVTFAEFAPEWIATYGGRTSKGIEEHTRRDYQAALEADAIPFFGRTRLTAITAQDVKRYAAHVASRGVSANTVRLAVAPVRCLLADAFEQGLLRSNPAAGLRLSLPATTRRACVSETEDDEGEVKALTDAELARFIAALPERWWLFFEFLGESGLRIGEAIEVRRRDVDLAGRWLHIRRRYYRGRIGLPKGRKTRRVRLSVAMADRLRSHVANLDADELVFTGPRGARIDRANLGRRVLKPAAAKAGLGKWIETPKGKRAESWVHLHTFRHTAATRLFRGGWNAVQVQRFLGHTDPGFTLRTYVHLLAEDLPEVPFGNLASVKRLRNEAA